MAERYLESDYDYPREKFTYYLELACESKELHPKVKDAIITLWLQENHPDVVDFVFSVDN